MLESLITSKTRVKLLVKFFLSPSAIGYLRSLAVEFNESSNAIRIELNRLEAAGILESYYEGNKRLFIANKSYPLYNEIIKIVHKHVGLDKIAENIAKKLGNVEEIFLTGSIVQGIDTGELNIVLVGNEIDKKYLSNLVRKAEHMIDRKISFLCFDQLSFKEFKSHLDSNVLLIWKQKSTLIVN